MTDFVTNQRLFNDTVNKAKKYVVDSLHSVNGAYLSDGYSRRRTDEYGFDSVTYYDLNKDGWIDKIQKESNEKTTVVVQNQNPNEDNLFDYYAEYDNKGNLYKTAQDRDKNGKYDIVSIYKDGVLEQTIEDITNDGVPELYKFYDENGKVIKEIDTRSWLTALADKIFSKEVEFR